MLLTKKQRKKERKKSPENNTLSPYRGRSNYKNSYRVGQNRTMIFVRRNLSITLVKFATPLAATFANISAEKYNRNVWFESKSTVISFRYVTHLENIEVVKCRAWSFCFSIWEHKMKVNLKSPTCLKHGVDAFKTPLAVNSVWCFVFCVILWEQSCNYLQVYPTTIRALGMGLCTATARVGAIISPFVAQVGPVFLWHYWHAGSAVITIAIRLWYDYTTTIRLWRIAHACFQFDVSKKWTCQFFVVVVS